MDVLEPREAMLMRLLQIHDDAAGEDTDAGAIVATLEGYISGVPQLFTTEIDGAFIFADREQAESFVADFPDALQKPQVLDCP